MVVNRSVRTDTMGCSDMKTLLMAVAALAVLAYTVYDYCSLPIVEVSNTTGKCVAVYNSEYTCDTLPANQRYHHQWVK